MSSRARRPEAPLVPPQMKELGVVRIATPCRAKWAAMKGDARVRYCERCAKNVYNLTELDADEARLLLKESEGRLCVKFWARSDGTVITRDCPIGVRWRTWKWAAALIAFVNLVAAAVGALRPTPAGSDPSTAPATASKARVKQYMGGSWNSPTY